MPGLRGRRTRATEAGLHDMISSSLTSRSSDDTSPAGAPLYSYSKGNPISKMIIVIAVISAMHVGAYCRGLTGASKALS